MMTRLKNCTPEFARMCFPEQSGNVLFDTKGSHQVLLLTDKTVLALCAESTHLNHKNSNFGWFPTGDIWYSDILDEWLTGEKKEWSGKTNKLILHEFLKKSSRHGDCKEWFSDGRLKSHVIYKKGTIAEIVFDAYYHR